jgi:hypothetical protein
LAGVGTSSLRITSSVGINHDLDVPVSQLTAAGAASKINLENNGLWVKFSGMGLPALNMSEYEKLQEQDGEASLVCCLAPFLQNLVKEAAVQLDMPLELVSSERHHWIEYTSLKKPKPLAPDMFISHPAFINFTMSPKDVASNATKSFFGKPAIMDLCDSLEVPIIEVRRDWGKDFHYPLGRAMMLSSLISRFQRNQAVQLDTARLKQIKAILIDAKKFALVKIKEGKTEHCLHGRLTDAGTRQAIIDFIKEGYPNDNRAWAGAIKCLQKEYHAILWSR